MLIVKGRGLSDEDMKRLDIGLKCLGLDTWAEYMGVDEEGGPQRHTGS